MNEMAMDVLASGNCFSFDSLIWYVVIARMTMFVKKSVSNETCNLFLYILVFCVRDIPPCTIGSGVVEYGNCRGCVE